MKFEYCLVQIVENETTEKKLVMALRTISNDPCEVCLTWKVEQREIKLENS
jgi:hypothetical protein